MSTQIESIVPFLDAVNVGLYLQESIDNTKFSKIIIQAINTYEQIENKYFTPASELEIDEVMKLFKDSQVRNAYSLGIRKWLLYNKALSELKKYFLDYKLGELKADVPEMINRLREILTSPYFSSFCRLPCFRLYHFLNENSDLLIDVEKLNAFYQDLINFPNINKHLVMENVMDIIKKTAEKISARAIRLLEITDTSTDNCSIYTTKNNIKLYFPDLNTKPSINWLPRLIFRQLCLFEMCPYFKLSLNIDGLAEIYRAMRYFKPSAVSNIYASFDINLFGELLQLAKTVLTVLFAQCTTSENSDGAVSFAELTKTIPWRSIYVRSTLVHIGKLYDANVIKEENYHKSTLLPSSYTNLKIGDDLDINTLAINTRNYLQPKDFYIMEGFNKTLIELDFASVYCLGNSMLGLTLYPYCLQPSEKLTLIKSDSYMQQLDRGGVFALGDLMFIPQLELTVRRDHLIDDTFHKLVSRSNITYQRGNETPDSLKWPLRVKFVGEDAVDEGGVRKELFQLLSEQILNPDLGVFKYCRDKTLYWFFPHSFGTNVQLELIGIVVGLAVYNQIILDVSFPNVLYKKLLSGNKQLLINKGSESEIWRFPQNYNINNVAVSSKPLGMIAQFDLIKYLQAPENEAFDCREMTYCKQRKGSTIELVKYMALALNEYVPTLDDLEEIEPEICRSLREILSWPNDYDFDSLMISFSVTENHFAEIKTVPLKKKTGEAYSPDLTLKAENRTEYVQAMLNYYLIDSIRKEFDCFYTGFHRCCGGPTLAKLSPQELNLLVCGIPGNLDIENLKKGTIYNDGYTEDTPQIKWFWDVFKAMSPEQQRNLLFFITGSDRIPVTGLESLHLTIGKAGGDLNRLPSAHTCYNYLLLPPYLAKQILEEKLLLAIEHRHGFGLR